MNLEELLGKWYAVDAARYYQIVGKEISYYKMYIHRVVNDAIVYDSFIQFEDGSIQSLKVDRYAPLKEFEEEVRMGYMSKTKSTIRPQLNAIGRKYGLDITMEIS